MSDGDNDFRIREGIYAPGDDDPDDHPPTYAEDPGFYDDIDDREANADGDRYDETPVEWLFPDIPDDGITSDDFDNWPRKRGFPS